MTSFNQIVLRSAGRLALPLAVYPGLALTGATVSDIVTNPRIQFEVQAALQHHYGLPFVLSAMDLSAEAEAFGCGLMRSDSEVPTVTGRLVTSQAQADSLAVPQPGDQRTGVYLETVRLLRQLPSQPFVFAGCIGPFSLAARLVGMSEAMELTIADPGLMHTLLQKCTEFLTSYVKAFRAASAHGIIMAEPAAALLSPRMMVAYSSVYIKQIAAGAGDEPFAIVLHNCAAKLLHLPSVLETGLKAFHFGAPMDIATALDKVAPDVVLCGNLDPVGIFVRLSPAEVTGKARQLLAATTAHRNFAISSGCDLPHNTPLASLDAFYEALIPENASAIYRNQVKL